MRGRSYSPSPPRGYGRRGRSPSPRGRYGGGGGGGGHSRDLPTSLLVRNLRHDCRIEDLRRPFGQFGPLKDVYLPRDYYTGDPRGFGFIQYVDPADASEAKHHMDGQVLLGRQLTVVYAEENRKKPVEMRTRERGGGGGGGSRGRVYDRRRSPPPRHSRSPRYSRSPPPRHGRSDYYSPPKGGRQYSRSVSPQERRDSRERERSYSRSVSPPVRREHSPPYEGSRSRSPVVERSRSPVRDGSPGRRRVERVVVNRRSPSGSRSRSPVED
ncbi:serine/arginine-rich SC35-like splicing factor SCL30A [Impatiens glandulifera]|uniref:serine/arginine-rich SC35-like splicing factor SCL30A n=1 Tax=Impatiens glandulifera TaxID=253017 RepID=UPI001FB0ED8A|nr:serine/arginine-rich SC35-like splicing factor SCL30A [Impatiens glandulifera]